MAGWRTDRLSRSFLASHYGRRGRYSKSSRLNRAANAQLYGYMARCLLVRRTGVGQIRSPQLSAGIWRTVMPAVLSSKTVTPGRCYARFGVLLCCGHGLALAVCVQTQAMAAMDLPVSCHEIIPRAALSLERSSVNHLYECSVYLCIAHTSQRQALKHSIAYKLDKVMIAKTRSLPINMSLQTPRSRCAIVWWSAGCVHHSPIGVPAGLYRHGVFDWSYPL